MEALDAPPPNELTHINGYKQIGDFEFKSRNKLWSIMIGIFLFVFFFFILFVSIGISKVFSLVISWSDFFDDFSRFSRVFLVWTPLCFLVSGIHFLFHRFLFGFDWRCIVSMYFCTKVPMKIGDFSKKLFVPFWVYVIISIILFALYPVATTGVFIYASLILCHRDLVVAFELKKYQKDCLVVGNPSKEKVLSILAPVEANTGDSYSAGKF